MSTTPFLPSEWRGQNHRFSNISSEIRPLIRAEITPPNIYQSLLPSPQASVLDFISAKLPDVCKDTEQALYLARIPQDHTFFRTNTPVADTTILRTILVPPKGLVATLLAELPQKWLDGHNSIHLIYESISVFLPLWALKFWSDVHLLIIPIQNSWKRGIEWLKRPQFQPFHEVVLSTVKALDTLSWSGSISAGAFDFIQLPKSILPTYLSRDWLSNDHIDQILQSLDGKITHSLLLNSRKIHFIDTVCANNIRRAYSEDESGECPYDPTAGGSLPRFGTKLSPDCELAGIFHINGNHWIAIVINVAKQAILYGDPARLNIDYDLLLALSWFISQHVPSFPSVPPLHHELPCAHQDFSRDSWNCGIFSYNSLAHYFFPSTPLLQHTTNPAFADAARAQFLTDIILQFNEHTPLEDQAHPGSQDYNDFVGAAPQLSNLHPSLTIHLPPTKKLNPVQPSEQPQPPKKRAAKKQKTQQTRPSVVAPIFQIPKPASKLEKNDRKRKQKSDDEDTLAPSTPPLSSFHRFGTADPDDSGSSSESQDGANARNPGGRPRIGVLDHLTIELSRERGKRRRYRCAGRSCKVTWRPRTIGRVLAHCKSCLKMTAEQRQLAASASASSAPGALVDDIPWASSVSTQPPSDDSTRLQLKPKPCTVTPISLPPIADTFFGARGRKETHRALDLAVVQLICTARIPPTVADLPEWKNIFKLLCPSYSPASRTKLTDFHITSEQSLVCERQLKFLLKEHNISISFDGGSTRSGESLYTVHATTPSRRVILLEGQECTDVSHTGEWISGLVLRVIDTVGSSRIGAVSSDNTGNTRVARSIICNKLPHVLNLPDPEHFLNNVWKEIARLPFWSKAIEAIRGTLKYFKHANMAKARLRQLRIEQDLGAGLESIGKTRFATLVWSALSVRRCLPAIRNLVTTEAIEIPDWNEFYMSNTPATLQYEILLTQFIATGDPFARAILCLEATSTNPADVYLYFIAIVARLKQALETCHLPDDVCASIRVIINRRWNEFFVNGPTNVHRSAFYLNPDYVRSSIFSTPNALSFNIKLPAKDATKPKVPPGIRSPNTFLEVGKYLLHLLVIELENGSNTYLSQWKDKPAAFTKAYQTQFTAYAQGAFPFNLPLGAGQPPLDWWQSFEGTPDGGILAAIAIKLYSAVPHSMADERTMSYITMLNSAQRSRQKVNTIVAMAQVRGYYQAEQGMQHRRSIRPRPTVRFFDIKRLLRTIDDEDRDDDPNYDESDDEETIVVPNRKQVHHSTTCAPHEPATSLPIEEEASEIDLTCPVILELLADGPVVRKGRPSQPARAATAEDEAGGTFELQDWV